MASERISIALQQPPVPMYNIPHDFDDFFFDFFRLLPESSSESVEADRLARLRSFLCLRFLRFLLLLRAGATAGAPPPPAPPPASVSALLSDDEESVSELLESLELPRPPDLLALEGFSSLAFLLLPPLFPVVVAGGAACASSRFASSCRWYRSPDSSRRCSAERLRVWRSSRCGERSDRVVVPVVELGATAVLSSPWPMSSRVRLLLRDEPRRRSDNDGLLRLLPPLPAAIDDEFVAAGPVATDERPDPLPLPRPAGGVRERLYCDDDEPSDTLVPRRSLTDVRDAPPPPPPPPAIVYSFCRSTLIFLISIGRIALMARVKIAFSARFSTSLVTLPPAVTAEPLPLPPVVMVSKAPPAAAAAAAAAADSPSSHLDSSGMNALLAPLATFVCSPSSSSCSKSKFACRSSTESDRFSSMSPSLSIFSA
uniref:Uncharacterized protein n=1 Tax=Anopheles atroparvus TaxID=41427 RepID=A0A182JE47_ANOAO